MSDIYSEISISAMEVELEKIASKEGIIFGNFLRAIGLKGTGDRIARASNNYMAGARGVKKRLAQQGTDEFKTKTQKYLSGPVNEAVGAGVGIAADPIAGSIATMGLPGPLTPLVGRLYLKPRAAAARQVARMQGKKPEQVKAIGEWAQRSDAYPSTILGYETPGAKLYAQEIKKPSRRLLGKGGDLDYLLRTPSRQIQSLRRRFQNRQAKKLTMKN